MSKVLRLSVNLNPETADALKEIAHSQGIPLTEAIRRAISFYKFIRDEWRAGRMVHTMERNGEDKREIVFF